MVTRSTHLSKDCYSQLVLQFDVQSSWIAGAATTLFSIILICSYLYSVCLVFAVLKNTYFKKHFSVVASQWRLCNTENNTLEFKLCLMLKHSPMEKAWFMAPMEYIPNGKGIIVPIEYTLTVFSPNGKGMVL